MGFEVWGFCGSGVFAFEVCNRVLGLGFRNGLAGSGFSVSAFLALANVNHSSSSSGKRAVNFNCTDIGDGSSVLVAISVLQQ